MLGLKQKTHRWEDVNYDDSKMEPKTVVTMTHHPYIKKDPINGSRLLTEQKT